MESNGGRRKGRLRSERREICKEGGTVGDPEPSPGSSRPTRPGRGARSAAATCLRPQSILLPAGARLRPQAYGAAAGPNLSTAKRQARTAPPAGRGAHSPLLLGFRRLYFTRELHPYPHPAVGKITETMRQSRRKVTIQNMWQHFMFFYFRSSFIVIIHLGLTTNL